MSSKVTAETAPHSLVTQVMRFLGVGVIAFVIDFGAMVFLVEVLGFNSVVAAAVSYVISVIVNYLLSMRFVFRHRSDLSRHREFIIFVVLSTIGLGINVGLMWVGENAIGLDYRIAKLSVTVIVTLWNFVTRKLFLDASHS